MYRVHATPQFAKDLAKLDASVRARILAKIEWLAEHPELLRSPMRYLPKDLRGIQKYRVGDWRIFFSVDRQTKTITLYGVEHRRSAYRDW